MTTIDLDDRVLSPSDSATARSSAWATVSTIVLLAVVTVWGLYTCYANLGGANLQADEPTYLGAGLNYVHGIFTQNREHPPLAKYFIGEAQVIGPTGKVSARFITTTFVFLTGWVILIWLRREIGLVWAVVATAAWWLLPRAAAGAGIRIDRFAILEPYMVAFAVASLAIAWWWYRKGSWWLAAGAGILMAASVTSKVSTAVLVLSFVYLAFRRKQLRRGLLSIAVYAVAFAVTFTAVYLPAGFLSSIEYMIRFQSAQRDGTTGARSLSPWWDNLYYTLQGLGPWLLVALLVAMIFAFVPRPTELTVYLGVCTVLLLVFYCLVAGKALPHYYYAWVWAMIILGVLGLRNLWNLASPLASRRSHGQAKPWALARAVAVGVLLVFVANAAVTSLTIRHERPTGWALVQQVLQEQGQPNRWVLATGYPSWEWMPYLGGHVMTPILTMPPGATESSEGTWTLPKPAVPLDAIAMTTDDKPVNPTVQSFVALNRSQFRRVEVSGVTLYIPTGHRQVVLSGSKLSFAPAGND